MRPLEGPRVKYSLRFLSRSGRMVCLTWILEG